jgi:hypothetical protein
MTYKKLFIIIIILLTAGAGFLAYRSYLANRSHETNRTNEADTTDASNKSYTTNKTDAASLPSAKSEIYNNPDHNFSLELLPGLSTNAFEEGDGDVVLIQLNKSYMSNESFKSYSAFQMQITVRPFDEDVSLTAARIQKEVPEIKMQNPISVKADGADAISFVDGADNTRQIWFVQNHELYQIIASPQYDNVTGKLMESWKWN